MSIFGRLAIGTANWGREYNEVKVPESEQKKILDYCREVGIDMIDTAAAYKNNVFDIAPDFKIVDKGDDTCVRRDVYAYLSHGMIWSVFRNRIFDVKRIGLSIYEPKDIPEFGTFGVPMADVIQVPYSLYDRRFEPYFPKLKDQGVEIHVRSIYLQGLILEKASPQDCLSFVLANPYIDRIIIGVDSLEQLKHNVAHLVRWESLKEDDINIIDPRKWKDENGT